MPMRLIPKFVHLYISEKLCSCDFIENPAMMAQKYSVLA